MNAESTTGLIVPVNVVAFCVGEIDSQEATNKFAGTTTVYTSQTTATNPAFLGSNVTRGLGDPPWQQLEQGVHLHWALPDALTKSLPGGELSFVAVPNRWLVTRFVVSGGSVTTKSWIIESDTLSTQPPDGQRCVTLPVTQVSKSDKNFRYVGKWQAFDTGWRSPTSQMKALTGRELTTVSSGVVSFASYYPDCRSVFGFSDALLDVPTPGSDPVQLMYAVTGWYGDATNDPLNGGMSVADLQQKLKWTVDCQDATPSYSIYNGIVQDIAWNPKTTYIYHQSSQLPLNVQASIGNNPAEAFSAYFRNLDHPDIPLFEPLLNAFQMGLFSSFQQPTTNQLQSLYEELHEEEFRSIDAGTVFAELIQNDTLKTGTIYSIVRDMDGGSGEQDEAIDIPLQLADALNLLNVYKGEYDLCQSAMIQFRWQLFADWYRIFVADQDTQNLAFQVAYRKYAEWGNLSNENDAIVTKLTTQLATVQGELSDGLILKEIPAPRYYQPGEPVVLISGDGLEYPERYGGDGRFNANGYLVCRLNNETLTAVTVQKTSIPASRFSSVTLPAPNGLPNTDLFSALLAEACLLNTRVASAITGATAAELQTALEKLLRGESQSSYQATGGVPSPVGTTWWNDNPWLPLFLRWEVEYLPLQPTATADRLLNYADQFFIGNFDIDQDTGGSISYAPNGPYGIKVDPATAGFDQTYTGAALLQASAARNFAAQLTEYLKTHTDATLQTILGQLQSSNILVQPLSGFDDALTMRKQSLQLTVAVPTGSEYDQFTGAVASVVQGENMVGPQFNGYFNPIRAGYMKLSLQAVDAFGQKRDVDFTELICAQSMIATDSNGTVVPSVAYLEPRLAQPSRLQFRWLAADSTGYEEMNAHPATSPVCGWLLPNHLDGSFFIYSQEGKPLGSLYLNGDDTQVEWQSAPGNNFTINESIETVLQYENPQLRELAISLKNGTAEFFKAFWRSVDTVHGYISPQNLASNSGIAVLIGRPVAIVQASLRLEVAGGPALNQGWLCFADDDYQETDNNFSGVQFPAILGDLSQLDDGLVGYFKQNASGNDYDLATFYTDGADKESDGGVVRPSKTNLLLTSSPKIDSPEPPNLAPYTQKVLLLMDPRAPLHVTTGILPTKSLSLPSDLVDGALSILEMSFLTTPVLHGAGGLALPVPPENGYQFSWVQEEQILGFPQWSVTPNILDVTGQAVWAYTPQRIVEGWLRMNPVLLEFELKNAAGNPVVIDKTANIMTLSLINRKGRSITFKPGELIAEGESNTGSIFYLHFSDLVSEANVPKIQLSAPGWTFKNLSDATYGQYWAATPAQPVTLEKDMSIEINVTNLIVSATGAQAQAYFDYYNIDGLNDGVYADLLAVQPAPTDELLESIGNAIRSNRPNSPIASRIKEDERMSTSQAFPQLSFQINNQDAANTIYITTDPTVNKLTFAISTNTNGTLFTPGQLVPKSQAGTATGSLLYLDLTALNMSSQEFAALTFSAQGWTFQGFTDSGQVVCMTPTSNVTLNSGAGNAIDVSIGNLTLSNPPSSESVQLVTTAYRVQNITLGNLGIPTNFKVLLQVPPDKKDRDLHDSLQLNVPQIFVVNSIPSYTPVANSLSFTLSPGSTKRKIVAGDDTEFVVTFVYADAVPGYGALATPQQAVQFAVTAGINAQSWSITPGTNLQNPSWLLKPPSGKPIIGSGAQSTVEFLIGNIVTNFQPGPTLMLVSYSGVPGYQDGSYAVLLQKTPHVDIQSLTVTPNPTHLVNGQAQVTLNWTVYNGGTLTLMPLYQDVTGKTSFTATIRDTTVFTLEAQGLQLANAGNIAFKNVQAKVLPVINSFDADPSAIYKGDFSRNVYLSWNVNTNENVVISSSVSGPGVVSGDSNQYPPIGSVTKSISRPQMLTLSPVNDQSNLMLRRNIVLSAFDVQPTTMNTSFGASYVLAAPNAGFVAATNTAQNQIAILDTLGYQTMGSTVATGKAPLGMAFSSDGSTIFVANSGDGTVSIVNVTATGAMPPYSIASGGTLTAGGSPQQVALSPDGMYLYVSVDNGTETAGSLVVFKKNGTTFKQFTSITIGKSPRGVAVAPSGAQIFVANFTDNTVSVIGVSNSGGHSLVNTIANLQSGPVGLAVTPDGGTLLVACSGSNTVFGINTEFPGVSPRTSYTVGSSPRQIVVAPGGAYAYVANYGDGTLSLLSYDVNPQNCKVLKSGIPAGTNPSSLTLPSKGGVVTVANNGQNSLTVVTLAEYQGQPQSPSVVAQPTSVATSPDGGQVWVWHNSLLNIRGSGASTGFSVYETQSGTVTQQMAGTQVIDCVIAPVAGVNRAFLTQVNLNAISVLDTNTYQPTHTLTIQPRPSALNRYPTSLGISGDGSRVCAVVSDGQGAYSLVVYETDFATDTYTLVADLQMFTTSPQPTFVLLAVGPDGSSVFVVDSISGKLWKVQEDGTGAYAVVQTPVMVGSIPSAITILPDGSKVFVFNKGGLTNSISIVDAQNLGVQTVFLPEIVTSISINDIVASPDGTKIFATDGVAAGIRVLDARSLRFVQTISWTANVQFPFGIAVLPDGSRIFTANVNSNNLGIIQQVQPS